MNKALARLADQLTAQGTAVQLELDEDRVDPVQSALLYRFAREAVANVAKHARARVVRVVLAVDAGVVVLRIADDGVGFDPDAGSPAGHLGLTIMHDALSDGGGSLAIVSEHGAGTMLTATLPAY